MSERIQPAYVEGEVIHGLKPLATAELETLIQGKLKFKRSNDLEKIPMRLRGDWGQFLESRLLSAVYIVQPFPVPRPKSLLGDEYWGIIQEHIEIIFSHFPKKAFQTVKVSAAGSDSAVFQRIKGRLAEDTGLTVDEEEGDLLMRVRRGKHNVWEVLLRMTPRPLGTRPWRVANMPGALSGPLAAAMTVLTEPKSADRYLNMMCGSGSLLVERLLEERAELAVGCDLNREALWMSADNLDAAGLFADLLEADGMQVPFPDDHFDVVTADLPWGQLVGSHAQNEWLYPAVLAEAARVVRQDGRFVLITHEIQLMQETLEAFSNLWSVEETIKLEQGNVRPKIFVLRRR